MLLCLYTSSENPERHINKKNGLAREYETVNQDAVQSPIAYYTFGISVVVDRDEFPICAIPPDGHFVSTALLDLEYPVASCAD